MTKEETYWYFKRNSWQVPTALAVIITPFMIIGTVTESESLEIFSKLIWLLILLLFIAYNLLIRSLRKKFEGEGGTQS